MSDSDGRTATTHTWEEVIHFWMGNWSHIAIHLVVVVILLYREMLFQKA